MTKVVLNNCLRVLTLPTPAQRTVSIGLFINHGVKDEDEECNGISHFIEHVMFNPEHLPSETKRALDRLLEEGASYEAFTSKECTRFHVECLPEQFEDAIAVLGLLVCNWQISEAGVEQERKIILHEHATFFSSTRVLPELLEQAFWGPRSLGLFTLGSRSLITSVSAAAIAKRITDYYVPDRTYLVILGNIDIDTIITVVGRHLGQWKKGHAAPRPVAVDVTPSIIGLPTQGSRVDLSIGFLGPGFHAETRHTLSLLGDILGGGVKSRLFLELRQKRGLAYVVAANSVTYSQGGYLSLIINTKREEVPEVMTVLQEVLKQVREEGVTEEELRRCQAARRRAILELLGDSRRHGQLLGRYALLNHDLFVDLEAHSLSAVTPDDVQSFASQILTPPNMAVASFGLDGNALASLL